MVLPKPRDLLGHWETGSGAGSAINGSSGAGSAGAPGNIPVRPVASFSRQVVAEEARLATAYPTRISGSSATAMFDDDDVDSFIDPVWDSSLVSDELLGSFASTSVAASGGETSTSVNAQATRDAERLNRENRLLRSQLQQAKAINDEMWNRLVQERLSSSHVDVAASE